MTVRAHRANVGRVVTAATVISLGVTALPAAASAESFFDSFFRAFQAPSLPPHTQAFADPAAAAPDGHSAAFCVRLCDGRYFPIQRHVAATPVQLCNALCPASKTKVLFGGEINSAVASDGTRYADLDHAFLFRQRLVPSCTCNGKDAFGLAPIDVAADPTLRPGDMVATDKGVKTYTGARITHGAQSAEFAPTEKPAPVSGRR